MTANRAAERAGRQEPRAEAVLVLGPASVPGEETKGGIPDATGGRVPDDASGDLVVVTAGGRPSPGLDGSGADGDGDADGASDGDIDADGYANADAVIHLGAANPAGNSLHLRDLTGLSMRLEEAFAAGDGGVVRFDALGSLVVACDLPRLVRFLQTEFPRALANGYGVRARLDPAVVDRRAARAIAGAFDRCIDCRV